MTAPERLLVIMLVLSPIVAAVALTGWLWAKGSHSTDVWARVGDRLAGFPDARWLVVVQLQGDDPGGVYYATEPGEVVGLLADCAAANRGADVFDRGTDRRVGSTSMMGQGYWFDPAGERRADRLVERLHRDREEARS